MSTACFGKSAGPGSPRRRRRLQGGFERPVDALRPDEFERAARFLGNFLDILAVARVRRESGSEAIICSGYNAIDIEADQARGGGRPWAGEEVQEVRQKPEVIVFDEP